MDRIVYVGADGNIFTIAPDGSDSKRLTDNVQAGSRGVIHAQGLQPNSLFYTWPTWSPDGSRLAVSQVVILEELPAVSLFTLDPLTGQLDFVYENQGNTIPIIAQNVPHYMYWSPDSQKLAFIASAEEGLTLFVYRSGQETVTFRGLGPLYFKWADDSQSMLVHARDQLLSSKSPFNETPVGLGKMNPLFRAPDLSPDGTETTYLTDVTDGFGLFMGSASGEGESRLLEEIGGSAALTRSPLGNLIALVDSQPDSNRIHDRLRLFSSKGEPVRTLAEEPMLAFFWSPDGSKIAYVAFTPDGRSLVWKIAPVEGGEPWELMQFRPSPEFLAMLSFFDQYALSHSVWSPDSSRLVFAGTGTETSRGGNGSSPSLNKVYVINTAPGSQAKEVAGGTLAFWSWN